MDSDLENNKRVLYLDGLRGVAIIFVFLYHIFQRWPEYTGFNVNVFSYGKLGVQLFFMISGFVILMSLNRSNSKLEFLYKRWLRLFPLMLFASIFIYLTNGFFKFRPEGDVEIIDLIPGLTFISHNIYNLFLGADKLSSIEGVFWSLYVEFIFYIFSSLIFFCRRKNYIDILFVVFLLSNLIKVGLYYLFQDGFYYAFFIKLGFPYYGWFLIGAVFYLYTVSSDEFECRYFYYTFAAIFFYLLIAFVKDYLYFISMIVILILFYLPYISRSFEGFINNKCFLFFGSVSYFLYLIHENISISYIRTINHMNLDSTVIYSLFLISGGFGLVFFCWFTTKYIEPMFVRIIKSFITKYVEPILIEMIRRVGN